MKFLKYIIFLFVLFIILLPSSIFSQDYTKVASFEKDNLTITSYSKSWTEDKLKQLYTELTKNVTSSELSYLKNIYIYPNSPQGVNGHYFEDIHIIDGKYVYGKNSYIELYNGEKYNTISLIAPILSHEYGHHYVTFNMLRKENIYYNNIENSKYAKIRHIDTFPVYYIGSSSMYQYHWDLLEILADDYVQLLGSPNSKLSKDYKSSDELVINKNLNNSGIYFNLKPSLNPYITLASEVKGLYSYFLELGDYTKSSPSLEKEPVLSNVEVSKTLNDELSYKIKWTEAIGNGPFEYTLIMYPKSNPLSPIPLKTVKTGENLEAIFGSYAIEDKNKNLLSVSNLYEGEFELKLFIKDSLNFIYDSNPITFNFDKADSLLPKEEPTSIDFLNSNSTTKSIIKTNNKPTVQTTNKPTNNKTIIGPLFSINTDLSKISFS